jgi:hypothetical protein
MSIKNDLTKNPPSSILLINIRLIGDVILSTPLIGALNLRRDGRTPKSIVWSTGEPGNGWKKIPALKR